MRILSKGEQELCARILKGNGQNNYLGNIIDNKLGGICIVIVRNPQSVSLEYTIENQYPTPEESESIIKSINEISNFILTAISLINLLEKEGYILILKKADQGNASRFGGCISNLPCVSSQFVDDNISNLLIKFVDKEIIVTEEFRRFCKDKYIARDERRFTKQYIISTSALVITTLALFTNTFFNILPRITGGTRIKQEQIDTLSYGIGRVKNAIDTLNRNIIKRDTTRINRSKKK